MAKEINIQASLTFQKYVPSTPGLQGTSNLDIDQSAGAGQTKSAIANVQNIGTTAESLALGDVNTGPTSSEGLFYLFVKNLGPTNYLELSTDNFTKIFAKLRVNEFCLVPVSQTFNNAAVAFAKANTAAVDALVVAVSP